MFIQYISSQLLVRVGGWSDKTKVILNSTQVEIEVEVGVELGNANLYEETQEREPCRFILLERLFTFLNSVTTPAAASFFSNLPKVLKLAKLFDTWLIVELLLIYVASTISYHLKTVHTILHS